MLVNCRYEMRFTPYYKNMWLPTATGQDILKAATSRCLLNVNRKETLLEHASIFFSTQFSRFLPEKQTAFTVNIPKNNL